MKKILIIPAIALGVFAMCGSVFANGNKKSLIAHAAGELSPYSIADSSFELAMLESYEATADGSSKDRPLGAKLLAKDLYDSGSSAYNGTKTRSLDVHVSDERVNPTLEWKIDCFRPYYNGEVMRFILRAGTSTINMYDPDQFGEGTDEYALSSVLRAADPSFTVRGGAMISNVVMTDIQDISIYWRYSDCRRFFVCYQLENTTDWKVLVKYNMQDSGIIEGNYQGTRGWDAYGFTTFNYGSWNTHELKGANAKIAFVASHNTTDGNMQLSSIRINANNAAVRYLNNLSYQQKMCTVDASNLKDLHRTVADYSHAQDLYQFATERAEANFLKQYSVGGSQTSETTALGLYNYFVSAIPGLGNTKTPNASITGDLFTNNSSTASTLVIASVITALAVVLGAGTYLAAKKKHN